MEARLKLDLNALAVESFEAANPHQPSKEPENVNVLTCMQTDCGRYRCCA
jgi:hypothetical protein